MTSPSSLLCLLGLHRPRPATLWRCTGLRLGVACERPGCTWEQEREVTVIEGGKADIETRIEERATQ